MAFGIVQKISCKSEQIIYLGKKEVEKNEYKSEE